MPPRPGRWLTLVAVSVVAVVSALFVGEVWPRAAQAQNSASEKAGATPASASPAAAATPHVVQRGESVPSLVHTYLPQTTFMTSAELDEALRKANPELKGNTLKPGQSVLIPGMEGPIQEKSVTVPRDFEVRAIYLTGLMASSPHGIEIMKRWHEAGGNAVVFDIKDSDGIVNIPFDYPLNAGAPRPYIRNLPKLVRFLHSMNMHAIARIAIFRDERLVTHHPELAVQSRSTGKPWKENGKLVWTDPSHSEVEKYDIALAVRAAEEGVDEVQFDYVRFPAEGDQKDAKFQFQAEHPDWQRSDVIVHFLDQAYAALHPKGVLLSLDVFGVMAWQRPVDLSHTGQDIVRMAKYCDVLSPMIYPSHFFGMDGYAMPGDAPEHFISESMQRFRLITYGSGVVLRPWLQAFGWRTKTYSPAYIMTQVKVARDEGGNGFLFWNARNDYSKPYAAMPEMTKNADRYFGRVTLPPPAPKREQKVANEQKPVVHRSTAIPRLKRVKASPANQATIRPAQQ